MNGRLCNIFRYLCMLGMVLFWGSVSPAHAQKPLKKPHNRWVILYETGVIDRHAYVDMGVGPKWAMYNVGARKPQEYGDFYAWGEVHSKTKFMDENALMMKNKLNTISGYKLYDVARNRWGGGWRIPTIHEFKELIKNCTVTWYTYLGVGGYLLKSNINGNYLFLPAAGYRYGDRLTIHKRGQSGNYWSSTRETDSNLRHALSLSFTQKFGIEWPLSLCSPGRTVRAVHD